MTLHGRFFGIVLSGEASSTFYLILSEVRRIDTLFFEMERFC